MSTQAAAVPDYDPGLIDGGAFGPVGELLIVAFWVGCALAAVGLFAWLYWWVGRGGK